MANKFGTIDDEPHEQKNENPGNEKPEKNPKQENEKPEREDNDFWTPPPESNANTGEKTPEAPGDLAAALTYAVDLLHHELAVGTDFQGWELDDKEKEVWGSLWKQVLPYIAFQYLGIIVSLVIIAVFEMIKTGQYLKFRKAKAVPK